MTHYNVGSDHSGKGDEDCIARVCEILEQNGHTTTNLHVTPNLESRLRTGNKDDVGVFIVNGICLGTIVSCAKMAEAGGCGSVIFGIPKVLYGGHYKLPDELKTKKLHLADDDNFSPADVRAMDGKYTPDELFGLYGNVSYAYGDDCDQLANAIMNGTSNGSATNPQQNEGSVMSGWESITDLLKPLDGDAMVVVRGDSVVIKRIYPPTSTSLWAYEGINIVADSVKVSDYTPEIYNTFQINWGASFENSFEMCFEKHKELFGERRTEVDAIYEVPIEESDKDPYGNTTTTEETTEESNKDDGGIFGFITDSLMNVVTGGASGVVNGAINAVTLNDESREGVGDTKEEPTTMDIPITDEAEAHLFGLKQVGKAMRKSGHSIECKVIGNKRFEVGEWCRVHIPKFGEDNIMFISKVSHESSADSEWLTSLTLVDYPPSLGSGQSNTPSGGNMDVGGGDEEALMDASLSDTGTDTYDTYGEVI